MSKSIHIHGFHSVESILDSNPESILSIYIQAGRDDNRVNNLIITLNELKISFTHVDKIKLERLAKGETHQGIVAEIILPPLPGEDALIESIKKISGNPLVLVLDSIQDPRNLGACLRSANAAGVDCVVVNKDGSSPINAVVHKTSAGAINTLKIFQITNLTRTIKALQDNGLWVIGLDGKAETVIYDVNLSEATAIVMGAEGKGIRQLIKKTCDQLVSIPMIGSVQSLNVSVATGVALFESKRQRKTS